MNLTLFGASGATGRLLTAQALAAGHNVTVYVRNPAKLADRPAGLTILSGEMDNAAGIEATIAGADAVISTLGPTANRPGAPLTRGLEHIVAAMHQQGVRRLIVTTGAGVVDPQDEPPLIGRLIGRLLRLSARHILADSQGMVAVVQGSGLDWTVARAPRLTNEPGGGPIKAGYAGKGPGIHLARADFARFLLAQLEATEWVGKMPMVSN